MLKEETIKKLNEELTAKLKEVSELVSNVDFDSLNLELDKKVSLSNDSFMREVRNFSLISATVAPFSLTLLLSGLEIEKTFLIIAFCVFMINVLFLNIGSWYLNSKFGQSMASQKLEGLLMGSAALLFLDEKIEKDRRIKALFDLNESEARLRQKDAMQPYNQIKTLNSLRNGGIILLSGGVIFLIFSVVSAIF